MRLRRVALIAGTAAAGLLFGTGSAWAYFSTTGHGTGTAAAGQFSAQVLGSDAASPGLLPGGTGDAGLRMHNPQSIPVTVVSVEAAGPAVADNGCTPTGVSFTNQYQLDVVIPAGGTTTVPLPAAVSMSPAAAAACQGTGFSLPVTVTVRS